MKRAVAYLLAGLELFMVGMVAHPALAELEAMQANVTAALAAGAFCVLLVTPVVVMLLDSMRDPGFD